MDKINWADYGVDVDSANFWDKYNKASKNVGKSKSNADNQAEEIRDYCAKFRKFYNDLVGCSNADNILRGVRDNKRDMDAIYESLIDFIHAQKLESMQRMASILSKYAPKIRDSEDAKK